MPKSLIKLGFILFLMFFTYSFLFSQEVGEVEPSKEDVEITEDVEESSELDNKSDDKEVVKKKKKAEVSFDIGGMVTYDKDRLSTFYADYFGWLNLPLMGFGSSIPIPSGFSGGGITISGLDIVGHSTTLKIPFGGGVKVMNYNRGIDGNWIEYSEGEFGEWWDEGFWATQRQRELEGKTYIEDTYDVAFAQWGFEWMQNIKPKKSKGSNIDFYFAYRGLFNYWLEDNNPLSRQLLFETDYPDKKMSVVNKLIAQMSYSNTKSVDQQFSHGLYNNINTSIRFEAAPGILNPNVYGEKSQKKNEDGNPLYRYIDESSIIDNYERRTTSLATSEADFGAGGKTMLELTPTADYYKVDFNLGGRMALFDVDPNRASNIFSGYISANTYVNWMSEMGWDGYIPIIMRSGVPRFKTGASVTYVMNLPVITVMDLKSWSTPKANIGFAKVENKVFEIINIFGLGMSRERFNNMVFIRPIVSIGLGANYFRDYDGSFKHFWAERDYQFTNDAREGFSMWGHAKIGVAIFDLITATIGVSADFNNMGFSLMPIM